MTALKADPISFITTPFDHLENIKTRLDLIDIEQANLNREKRAERTAHLLAEFEKKRHEVERMLEHLLGNWNEKDLSVNEHGYVIPLVNGRHWLLITPPVKNYTAGSYKARVWYNPTGNFEGDALKGSNCREVYSVFERLLDENESADITTRNILRQIVAEVEKLEEAMPTDFGHGTVLVNGVETPYKDAPRTIVVSLPADKVDIVNVWIAEELKVEQIVGVGTTVVVLIKNRWSKIGRFII